MTEPSFTFEQLSDQAKQTVRDHRRYAEVDGSYDWWDFTYEDAIRVGSLMGIEIGTRNRRTMSNNTVSTPAIWFSGFASQGDGACYDGHYRYEEGAVAAVAAYAPEDKELHRIAEGLTALQLGLKLTHAQTMTVDVTSRGHGMHSGTMQFNFGLRDGTDSDDFGDEEFSDTQYSFIALLRSFADWIYRQLEAEHDHLTSDEALDERLSNDDATQYTEDGDFA